MKKTILSIKTIFLTAIIIFGVGAIQGLSGYSSVSFEQSYTVQLDYTHFDLTFDSISVNGEEYTTIDLLDQGHTTIIGQAKIPMMRTMVQIPQGSDPLLYIISEQWEETSLDSLDLPEKIFPVQPSIPKSGSPYIPDEFSIDLDFYSQNIFFPLETGVIIETGEIRSRRYAFVEITPVRYNPKTAEIHLLTECTVEIVVQDPLYEETYAAMQRYYSPAHETFLKTVFTNYGDLEKNVLLSPKTPVGYLFIVHDDFYSSIQPLVTVKQNKGFDVTVTKTSDIPGGVTVSNIEDYIEDAYYNWQIPPAYLLLVGDTPQIPTKTTGLQSGVSCSDLYYVTINPEDYFPDIYIGRFSAATADDVSAIVDKTVYYETGSYPSDEWIKNAAFIASSDFGKLAEETHDFVIENYLEPNEFNVTKIYQASGGSTSDIINAVNQGVSILVYSGHGYSGGWGCVPFNQNNVQNLQNEGMYPFVCSHACTTNPFNNPSEIFGETWIRQPNKGGIAFWGASGYTYWYEDDILERGMFHAWWHDNLTSIGGMTDMGLYYVYLNYAGGGKSRYYFEAYNVLGDPSIVLVASPGGTNLPPQKPDTPQGPNTGDTGVQYIFTTSTTDPDNDKVYYMWHWGDSISDWFGPYNSGEIVEFGHVWNHPGEYDIKVKAKDETGLESIWSDPLTIIIIAIPVIEIGEITGGFGVNAVIKNVGAAEAFNVEWTIGLDGFVIFGREKSGTFTKIMAGFGPTAKSGFIFGFGPVGVTVTADDVEKNASAKLFGPYVYGID
ncbi:MAG: C25 family cysteine peptidase [Thermoplasmatota archaeon]